MINKFIYYIFEYFITSEKNKLMNSIVLLFAFMNPELAFFLYTLTRRSFRHEFVRAWKDLLIEGKFCYCRNRFKNDKETVN